MMRHTYLTLELIGEAFKLGGITLTEANELLQQLERCRELYLKRNS